MTGSIRDALNHALSEYFGFTGFKPNQERIVSAILEGQDVFAVMPTGGGKSLCYQLPSLLQPGLTLVVSPLIALMKDQVDAARLSGIPADYLNSTLSAEEARAAYARVAGGETKLLYIAPERFSFDGFKNLMADVPVSLVAVDEAHCISEWGHEFRPDYRELSRLKDLYPGVPLAAFTATATVKVQDDIISLLRLHSPLIVRASFDRPELCYRIVRKQEVSRQILDFIRVLPDQAGIVYRATRKSVESTAKYLVEAGVRAVPYHAGLSDQERHRNQEMFKNDEADTVVATIAFGMGIDKSNIRYVVHGDLPRSVEGYYQETGRAGRDGEPADCLLLYGPGDIAKVRYHIDRMQDSGEKERAVRNLNRMIGFAQTNVCRRVSLLGYFGESYTPPCGSCDVCRGEVVTQDATVDAQKFLSAAVRTGQRFGRHYLADVLIGSTAERVLSYGHDSLPTYGVGRDKPKRYWLGIAEELIAQGFIAVSEDRYSILSLTRTGRELMRGEHEFRITSVNLPEERQPEELPFEPVLFERLRTLRKITASEIGRPPYMVFSDRSLKDMAVKMPGTETEMLAVHGVGTAKLKTFGSRFLEEIRKYRESTEF